MGLDIMFARTEYEHAFRAGSYSGFGLFRDVLAVEEDIVLDEMYGFGGTRQWASVETPLEPLLNHSDCDGEIYDWQAEQMLGRMKEIYSLWKNGHFSWDRKYPKKKLSDEDKSWYTDSLARWIKACERIANPDNNEYLLFA